MAWLKLGREDLLWLEGAEDFDVLTLERAVATQVKLVRDERKITLESPTATKSIRHYWELQQQNQGRSVAYRLLTTAERGSERGRLFGELNGLDYWDRCRDRGASPQPIRDFLRSQSGLPASLLSVISESTDDEFVAQLVRPISWDTSATGVSGIRELAIHELIQLGESPSLAFPPHAAQGLASILYDFLSRRITEPGDHSVNRAELRQVIERATSIPIPLAMLRSLIPQLALTVDPAAPGDQPTVLSLVKYGAVVDAPAPLPAKCSRRVAQATRIRETIGTAQPLFLIGSSGMGKSTLASLCAQGDSRAWKWIRLTGMQPQEIAHRLLSVARVLDPTWTGTVLALDDISWEPHVDRLRLALEALLIATTRYGVSLVGTSQQALPPSVLGIFSNAPRVIPVVPLELPEIDEVLTAHGCPEDLLTPWASLALAHSSGHPALVHARARRLEAEGWPAPTAENALIAEDLDVVRLEARRRLLQESPTPDASVMASKLSLMIGPFTRDQAIQLCSTEPRVANPGLILDMLVGPWVELEENGRLRVSPLLSSAAASVWGPEVIRALHHSAGEIRLRGPLLGIGDIQAGLLHAVLGGELKSLVAVTTWLAGTALHEHPELARSIAPFAELSARAAERTLREKPTVICLLQMLRLQCSYSAEDWEDAAEASTVLGRWIARTEPPEMQRAFRGYFLGTLLIGSKIPLPPTKFVEYAAELAVMSDDSYSGAVPRSELVGHIVPTLGSLRYRSRSDVEEMLVALDRVPDDARQSLLSTLKDQPDTAEHLLNSMWLAESHLETPNWPDTLRVIRLAKQLAQRWRLDSLFAAAARAECVVTDEYLHDPATALAGIREARAQSGSRSSVLDLGEFMVLFRQTQYRLALDLGRPILERLKGSIQRAFLAHHLIICLGGLGLMDEVPAIATVGMLAAKNAGMDSMHVGFMLESAFASWYAGDKRRGVTEAIAAAEFSETLNTDDLEGLAVVRLSGHALSWMSREEGSSHEALQAPRLGVFSARERSNEAGWRALPTLPRSLFWALAANLEYRFGTGDSALRALKRAFESDRNPGARFMLAMLNLERAFAARAFQSLPKLYGEIVRSRPGARSERLTISGAGVAAPASSEVGGELAESSPSLVNLFTSALTVKFAETTEIDLRLVESWIDDAREAGFDVETVSEAVALLKLRKEDDDGRVRSVMKHGESPVHLRCMAALALISEQNVAANDLVYAHILLSLLFYEQLERHEVVVPWETLVSTQWRRVATTQQFNFRAPAVDASNLLRACDSALNGLNKVADILLAAMQATGIGQNLRSRIVAIKTDDQANEAPGSRGRTVPTPG